MSLEKPSPLEGGTNLKPMLPSLTFDIPKGQEWVYEVKYDGFRALLFYNKDFQLMSRNGKSLLEQFPEIQLYLNEISSLLKPFAPLCFDGELVSLVNPYKGEFSRLQARGKMRSKVKMKGASEGNPCQLVIFDLLQVNGTWITGKSYEERKRKLEKLFDELALPLIPGERSTDLIQYVPSFEDFEWLWEKVVLYDGEGIVAKDKRQPWVEGKRSQNWLKYKNWKMVSSFITAYDSRNGYYSVGVYKNEKVEGIGQVFSGFTPEEKDALNKVIKENKRKEENGAILVEPAICIDIKFLEWYEDQMREPHFSRFRFDLEPRDCTYEKMILNSKNFPDDLEITHPEKPIWNDPSILKIDYLHYLREIGPYLLPFLKNRLLTVIRYPHGVFGEPFYQKNCPDYAPSFVETKRVDSIDYIICNDLKTLLWLGNQLSLEFHIPFHTIEHTNPVEIVFDLDPPSKERLDLAIEAALLIKEVLDSLELVSFVKTSGSKGLQIYIPLPTNQFTFEDTRLFTAFMADYLVSKEPTLFTTERLKKNRSGRLYIDYVQHGEGKTIVAPYSPRGRERATIATPLYWDEVNEHLRIEQFQITNLKERIDKKGDPFRDYFQVMENQNFRPVLNFLTKK